jgi:hypothetical protein
MAASEGPGGPGDCSPRAPTDPYVPSRAYGSSRHELATGRHKLRPVPDPAIRCCCVSTVLGFDAPAMFPSNGVMTWRPLLSTGSLGMVPRFSDTTGRSDSPPSVSTRSISSRADTIVFARGLLPSVVGVSGRPTGGQGVVGSGLPIRNYDGNVGVSQVAWKP